MVGALQAPQEIAVAAGEVGRRRHALEILGTERCFALGAREQLAGVGPGAAVEGVAAPPERVGSVHTR
jgi:hypothetical protein